MAALLAADVDAAIRVRGGLPRLRERAAEAARGAALGLRVVYCGGSVTAQRDGWRPTFQAWLGRAFPAPLGHETRCAAMGNCGSKVLAFTAHEWVYPPHERLPDLVVIEAAINDGDSLVETGDAVGIRRALEGIVRGILTAAPQCEIILVCAYLRTDLPQLRRSGTLAWVNDDTGSAARIYRQDVPAIHEQIAEHYGLPTVSMSAALRSVPAAALDSLYRDDCHTTPAGAAVMASVVAACVQRCLAVDAPPSRTTSLVPALDPLHWASGRTRPVTQADLKLVMRPDGTPACTTRFVDVDPLTGSRGEWWLLAPGDDALHIEFEGTALALLTHQGPDSGVLRVVVTSDGGREQVTTKRVNLFDQHCYYYRLAVVLLASGLPAGRHTAHVTLEASPPDRSIAKRPLQPVIAGPLRLWLSHTLVMGTAAHTSRSITHEADAGGVAACSSRQQDDEPVAPQRQPLRA